MRLLSFPGPFRWAAFEKRPNRFLCLVRTPYGEEEAHLPNSGRLAELLRPGAPVLLRGEYTGRRTRSDLWGVRHEGGIVGIDSRTPNLVAAAAIRRGLLPEFAGFAVLSSEVRRGRSRFDFRLGDPGELLLEVKGVTLLREGIARFPDAPTERGTRHLRELARISREGGRAAVLFVVQRPAAGFAPNDETDPAFGEALREARRSGVTVLAVRLSVGEGWVDWGGPLPLAF